MTAFLTATTSTATSVSATAFTDMFISVLFFTLYYCTTTTV